MKRLRVPLTLAAIVLAALLLYTWNIGYSGISPFYGASAGSMAQNWRAFFFGALNPSATTTLDKLSGFLVPEALSVHLFGFSAWALALPQAIEGAVTIVASYFIGSRWRGANFGLALAGVMAFTPLLAAMFGHATEDAMLTMCMVLAFAACQRAVLSGRFGWMILALVWVAVGFQAKMLQAWLILPALAILWLLGSRASVRLRFLLLGVGAVIVTALSVSWMTAIQLVPAAQRPYVDGTTDDSMFSMVFGYNGVDRFLSGVVPGSVPQLFSSAASALNDTPHRVAELSPFKLFLPEFATQIGWLLPLAVAGLVLEIVVLWRARKADRPPTSTNPAAMPLGLAVWFLLPGAVLSIAFVPHATYFAQIALPIAAFALAGAAGLVRIWREATGRGWVLLPIAILVEAAWTCTTALDGPVALRFVALPVGILGLASAGILFWIRSSGGLTGRRLVTALAIASIASLVAPVAWSLCVLGSSGSGNAAYAGPHTNPLIAAPAVAVARPSSDSALHSPFQIPIPTPLDRRQRQLLAYLTPRTHGTRWLFATDSMSVSLAVLTKTNYDVIPLGGYSRLAPDPGSRRIRHLITSGQLRYVLLNPTAVALSVSNRDVETTRHWVSRHCRPVISGRYISGSATRLVLFDCASATTK